MNVEPKFENRMEIELKNNKELFESIIQNNERFKLSIGEILHEISDIKYIAKIWEFPCKSKYFLKIGLLLKILKKRVNT